MVIIKHGRSAYFVVSTIHCVQDIVTIEVVALNVVWITYQPTNVNKQTKNK